MKSQMTDQEIREKIESFLALIEAGECEDDVNDAICDFCAAYGERAWDIKQEVECERKIIIF